MLKVTKVQVKKAIKTQGQWKGVVVPCNMNPNSPWYSGSGVTFTSEDQMNQWLRAFEVQNCVNTQTGRYAAFYQ